MTGSFQFHEFHGKQKTHSVQTVTVIKRKELADLIHPVEMRYDLPFSAVFDDLKK